MAREDKKFKEHKYLKSKQHEEKYSSTGGVMATDSTDQ